jgi:hypothetical protein
MATTSQGIGFSFNGSPASEIRDLSWSYGGGYTVGRDAAYLPEAGSVSIQTLGAISYSIWGTRGTLLITGGGMALSVTAVCTDMGVQAQLNGVTVYSAEFTILT